MQGRAGSCLGGGSRGSRGKARLVSRDAGGLRVTSKNYHEDTKITKGEKSRSLVAALLGMTQRKQRNSQKQVLRRCASSLDSLGTGGMTNTAEMQKMKSRSLTAFGMTRSQLYFLLLCLFGFCFLTPGFTGCGGFLRRTGGFRERRGRRWVGRDRRRGRRGA